MEKEIITFEKLMDADFRQSSAGAMVIAQDISIIGADVIDDGDGEINIPCGLLLNGMRITIN